MERKKIKTYRETVLFLLVSFLLSCSHKPKMFQMEVSSDTTTCIIGGADSVTSILIYDVEKREDKDTIIYEIPQCNLWRTEDLPEKYKDSPIQMWTERSVYWEGVKVVNLFVTNPTDIPFTFGRDWILYKWNGEDWIIPEAFSDCGWQQDAFSTDKAPALHCFRIPVGDIYYLNKGKYRLVKTFFFWYEPNKDIKLSAEFEVE